MGHAYISQFLQNINLVSLGSESLRGVVLDLDQAGEPQHQLQPAHLRWWWPPRQCSAHHWRGFFRVKMSKSHLQLSTRKLHFRWIWREHTCPQIKWRGFFRRSSSAAVAFKVLCWGVRDDWKSWTSLSITCRLFHQPRWQNSSSISSRWRFLQCLFPTNI